MHSDVYYNTYSIENQLSQGMVEDYNEGFHERFVTDKVITERLMTREIRQDSHCFNLELFIWSLKDVQLCSIEDTQAQSLCE